MARPDPDRPGAERWVPDGADVSAALAALVADLRTASDAARSR